MVGKAGRKTEWRDSPADLAGGGLPYDFFCEDNPAINLFVFTGSAALGEAVGEQTLWGFTRQERFETMTGALVANKKHDGWFQSVNVLTGLTRTAPKA